MTVAELLAQHKANCACLDPIIPECRLEPDPGFEDRIRAAVARAVAAEKAEGD